MFAITELCLLIIPGWKKSVHACVGFSFNTASSNTECPSALSLHCASTGPQSPNTKSCDLSTFDGVPNTVLGSSNVPSVLTGHLVAKFQECLAFLITCVVLLPGFEIIPLLNAFNNAVRLVASVQL